MRRFILTMFDYLKESVDMDVNNFLISKGIIIDNYITRGTRGSIYSLKNGNILKISSYRIDSQYIDYMEMLGKSNEFLVDIINVFKFNGNLLIEMEKMEKITFNRWEKFDKVNSDEEILKGLFLSFLNYGNIKDDLEGSIYDFLNGDHHESVKLMDMVSDRELSDDDIEYILLDLDIMFYGQNELYNKYGLYLKDFHSGNIMESRKTNDYKLIDFL